jgi:hypothetical protein
MPPICCNAGIIEIEAGNSLMKLNRLILAADFAGMHPATFAASTVLTLRHSLHYLSPFM